MSVAAPQVITLGCRMNMAESARIAALVAGDPDLVVVNSCAVTNEAVRQTRQTIRRLRRDRPGARLLVTGCAAETDRAALAAMPEVDGLIANNAKLDARAWNVPHPPVLAARSGTRAFVAVQNGCDHACTFCIIPAGRGPSRSVAVADVLREVEQHLALGAPEVVLTGVDLTSWGHDLPGAPRLGVLVAALLVEFPTFTRLRLSSLDGVEIDGQLFEQIAGDPRIMPHIHLSLQHGDDLILKRMKRRHLRADAVELVTQLAKARPEIAFGADLIAGFPTEDETMHQANLSLINQLALVHGHIFPYSPRIGTPAARMPQVAPATSRRRAQELRAAVSAQRTDWLATKLGVAHSVLAERDGFGYTPDFARVALPPGTAPGTLVDIIPQRIDQGILA